MSHTLFFALTALLLSYAGVALFRRWAAHRLLDIPNERSSHTRPTPRGGGIAIVVVTLVGCIIFALMTSSTDWLKLGAYLTGAILIAGISWLDDVRTLSSTIRFGTHTIGALLVIAGYGSWHMVNVPLIGYVPLLWFGLPMTFLWIAGLTNAYNFMDGIDGIAAGQAVVAGIGWAIIGSIINHHLLVVLGILIASSSLGFLGHNWPPARIFMGDVGSAFLGYTFAVLPLILNAPVIPLVGFLLVWPFVFDTVFTILRRLKNGENVFASHRSHLYQRLVIAGYSHRAVTLLYIALACIGAVLAVLWFTRTSGSALAIVLALPTLCIGLWLTVVIAERRKSPLHTPPQRAKSQG